MKKLESYIQQHTFHDKVKEELSKVGITIAYSNNISEQGFTSVSVSHYLRAPDPEYTTDGYEELCRNDLETQHVLGVGMQVFSILLPSTVGEVRLDTCSTWDEVGKCWELNSHIDVRPFKSPVSTLP